MLWGDGTPTREFLYVDDCVEGLALAAERYDGADPVNLGTGEEIAIGDLARARARRDRVRGDDPLGHLEAERAAAPPARHDARRGAVRVHGRGPAGGGARPDGRLVPGDPRERERHGGGDPPHHRVRMARPRRPMRSRGTWSWRLAAILAFQIVATVALFFSVDSQRLADLPGRRPDLARHLGMAAREGDDRLRPYRTWLADAPRAADVDHGLELGTAPPADDRLAGRRARRRSRRLRSTTSAPASRAGSPASGARRRSRSHRSSRSPTSSSATTTRGSTSSCRRRSG